MAATAFGVFDPIASCTTKSSGMFMSNRYWSVAHLPSPNVAFVYSGRDGIEASVTSQYSSSTVIPFVRWMPAATYTAPLPIGMFQMLVLANGCRYLSRSPAGGGPTGRGGSSVAVAVGAGDATRRHHLRS